MKYYFFSLIALFITFMNTYAQKLVSGNFAAIYSEKQIQVKFDYKDALIKELPLEDFLEAEQSEFSNKEFADFNEEWEDMKKHHLTSFINSWNKKAKDKDLPRLVRDESPILLTVVFGRLDRDGEGYGTYVFSDTQTGKELAQISFKCDGGGIFGSMKNLIGEASEDNAEKFCKFVAGKRASQLKAAK